IGTMQLVSPPIGLSVIDLVPTGHVGAGYSYALRVAGGKPPYSFAESPFNPLPPGLALSPDGVLSGTPQQAGSFTVQPIVTDSTGEAMTVGTFTLVVAPVGKPVPLIRRFTTLFPGQVSVGQPFVSVPLDASLVSGGTPPYSWSVRPGSSLPPGLTLLN